MQEKTITLQNINPIEIFGVNNSKLKLIRSYFPKLKVVDRGSELKVKGEPELIEQFELKIDLILNYFERFHKLTEGDVEKLMLAEDENTVLKHPDDIIVHGNSGNRIKPRTPNQRKLVETVKKNDMVFAIGPAGTGKTYVGVAMAVRALKNKEVRRIILTRPAVEAGENLGFLPGDLKDKLDPYLQPLYDGLRDMIPAEKLEYLIETSVIQIAPLAYMRGRTLDNAFVILDEAQNATQAQLKMFLTRMGEHAKFIINGDPSQIDLPKYQSSGIHTALRVLQDVDGIGFVHFTDKDVVRHRLVKTIINKFKENEDFKNKKKENGSRNDH